jgi:hypothetical protein
MFWKRFSLWGVVFASAVCLFGCGGGSKPLSISVTPSATTVDGGDAVTLTATVTNDKSTNGTKDGVTWSVSGGGTLSSETTSSATYTAPAATSSAQTITITATSKAETSKTGKTTLTVPAAPSVTTTEANLAGSVGTAYAVTLAGSGGISPYIWSLDSTSASLPSCLAMTSAGVISGTPVASCAGTYAMVFKLTDSGTATPLTATATLNLIIAPAATIAFTTSPTLTAGTYNTAYSASIAATGGAGKLTYTMTGTLPTGLTFTNGVIAGTPTTIGAYSITATAADAYGDSSYQDFSLTVNPKTPALSFTTISAHTYGDAPFTVSASDATGAVSDGAITYAVTSGPATISGRTVTITGAGTVVLSASQTASSDGLYAAATATTSFTINPATPTLSFTAISTKVFGDSSFTVSAADTGSLVSNGAITYSVTSGPATISSNTLTMTGAGTVVLLASQAASSDGNYAATTATTSFTINPALSITSTTPLDSGVVGSIYSQALTATGGNGTYSWTPNSTCHATLGLDLSADGVLASSTALTSANKGTCTFTAQVSDTTSHTATADLNVTVSDVAITTTSLPPAYTGSAYSQSLAATGGTGPYTWSVVTNSSDLSALGLSLSSSGALTGSASGLTVGSAAFTVKAIDSTSAIATKHYTITVYAPLTVDSSTLGSSATATQSYNGYLTASGGSGTYNWTVTGLSDNLSYATNNNTMTVSGTPTSAATVTFAATVTDSLGNTVGPTTYTITVSALVPLTVSVDSGDVPQGMVGMPYTFNNVSIRGGTSPYTITYSNAPDGLSKDTTTQSLVGAPTASGTTTVTVTVTDSTSTKQTASTTFSLPVVAKTVAAHNSYLSGQYACYVKKFWKSGVTGGAGYTLYRGGGLIAFTADGSGAITGGEMDLNTPDDGYSSTSSLTGTYSVGSDNRGYLLFTVGSGSSALALAGGNLNNSSQFSEFALTAMDDAGSDPSGSHGSGHCYKQDTTALSGIWPTGGYVFSMSGEDSSGYPESLVGSLQFTTGTSNTTGSITGVMDEVDGVHIDENLSMAGTTAKGGTDSYGRLAMAIGPSGSTAAGMVMYMTNNTKGQALMMDTLSHNASSNADFFLGEARAQTSTILSASYPLTGNGLLYTDGVGVDTTGSTTSTTYNSQVVQFTGSSTAKKITVNSIVKNMGGTISKDTSDITGQTMSYTVDATTGRTLFTSDSEAHFYLYDTNSAAVLFVDGTSGSDAKAKVGWIEPQTAPTSGTWAVSNLATSYSMSKIENGNYDADAQSSVLTLSSTGAMSGYAQDESNENWANWDASLSGSGTATVTGNLSLDSTDGTYGLFNVNMTENSTTQIVSYCYAASVDTATNSSTRGRFVCVEDDSSSRLSIAQE